MPPRNFFCKMDDTLVCKNMAMTHLMLLLLLFCSFMEIECSFSDFDKIEKLPGQPQVRFQQYSGYVIVDKDKKKEKAFFYYFVEAEVDPASKPLVLWMNGGPGCSSVGIGGFSENGPFKTNGNGLLKNNYTWNSEANMLYFESPAGVGFSYSTDSLTMKTKMNDELTARDNLVFLKRWFMKFPQYKQRDLFLMGESYAGHYIPHLAQLMTQSNKKQKVFNLKGIALGNPALNFVTDFNSKAEFLWSHGLISDSTYNALTSVCNFSRYMSEVHRDSVSSLCSGVMDEVYNETSSFVDTYDVTLDVCISSVFAQSKAISPQVTNKIDVCLEDETVNYLNRKDVQKALHARLVGVKIWNVSSDILNYDLRDVEKPTISVVGSLVKEGIPVLIYSGDQDSVIPLTTTRTLVHGLAKQLGLNTTVPYRVWFQGQQVGGWTQVYGNILSYATIRGAGHEAPFSQPERSMVLFKSFLKGRPLPEKFS